MEYPYLLKTKEGLKGFYDIVSLFVFIKNLPGDTVIFDSVSDCHNEYSTTCVKDILSLIDDTKDQ